MHSHSPHPHHLYLHSLAPRAITSAGTQDLIIMFLLRYYRLIPLSSDILAVVLNQEPRLASLSELEEENLG